jgi:hypothetical protein
MYVEYSSQPDPAGTVRGTQAGHKVSGTGIHPPCVRRSDARMLLCGLSWTRSLRAPGLREEEPRKNSSSASMISSGRDGGDGLRCS